MLGTDHERGDQRLAIIGNFAPYWTGAKAPAHHDHSWARKAKQQPELVGIICWSATGPVLVESVHGTRCLMSDVVGEVLGLLYSSCWRALHSEASTPLNERLC